MSEYQRGYDAAEEKYKDSINKLKKRYNREMEVLKTKHLDAFVPGNDAQPSIVEKVIEKIVEKPVGVATPIEIAKEWLKIMDKIVPEDQQNKYKIVYTRINELIKLL